ncbi:hypothetical protein B0H14DRAFT_2400239, partial [Mycena olivaceomarginata]
EVVDHIKQQLNRLREAGAPLNLSGVQMIIIATVHKMSPEVFDRTYADGSYFRVSDSYCRAFLRITMDWSVRKATKSAQSTPAKLGRACGLASRPRHQK